MSDPDIVLRDHPQRLRYELHVDEKFAGFTEYELGTEEIAFVHTETFPDFAGQGLAAKIAAGALDDARARGLAVLPRCPYIRRFISKHTEYLDLVPQARRAQFGL